MSNQTQGSTANATIIFDSSDILSPPVRGEIYLPPLRCKVIFLKIKYKLMTADELLPKENTS